MPILHTFTQSLVHLSTLVVYFYFLFYFIIKYANNKRRFSLKCISRFHVVIAVDDQQKKLCVSVVYVCICDVNVFVTVCDGNKTVINHRIDERITSFFN